MINLKYFTEKAALNKDSKTGLLLVELEGQKKTVKKAIKRQKLNLSLVIDVSGSMAENIGRREQLVRDGYADSVFGSSLDTSRIMAMINHRIPQFNSPYGGVYTNKMELVKKAAIKAVSELKEGDYVSLVTFNNAAHIIQDAQKVTEESKKSIITKIMGLRAGGGTDLHTGWVHGATEVVKNVKEKYINRVLVLTDGETVSGVRDPKQIAADVGALYKTGVTTSTFGVGDTFNEKLLQAMSEQGGGNFYYIKDESEFDQMFAEEFTGMLNLAASEVEMVLKLNEGFKLNEQMNSYVEIDGKYNLSNILADKKISVLFKLDTTIKNGVSRVNIGDITVKFKDENGNKVEQTITVEVDVLSAKKWEKLDFVQEVKIQETLLIIAKNKLDASNAIASGNIEGAKNILRGATATLSASTFSDDRIGTSLNSLNTTLEQADTMSNQEFSKTMHYESYKTRTGKGL
jgi:Ca-activated chloride channel family protein